MAKNLHPKIQALRSSVGYKPTYEFMPCRKAYEGTKKEYRLPKVDKDDDRTITQYFCIWDVADDYGTIPMKGFAKKSINERGPDTKATNKIVVLNQHRATMPLCIPMEIVEDEIGMYGKYRPDEGIDDNDDLVIRVKSGTINGGSYGFAYCWDKMEYDDKIDKIRMFEAEIHELSPVTFASQSPTFVVRGHIPAELEEQTQELLRKIPKQHQLEVRGLIAQYISLTQEQPDTQPEKPLKKRKPKKKDVLDFDYILDNLNL